jgi:hypothetical protein
MLLNYFILFFTHEKIPNFVSHKYKIDAYIYKKNNFPSSFEFILDEKIFLRFPQISLTCML